MNEINTDQIFSELNNMMNLLIRIKTLIAPLSDFQTKNIEKIKNQILKEQPVHNISNQSIQIEPNQSNQNLKNNNLFVHKEIKIKNETQETQSNCYDISNNSINKMTQSPNYQAKNLTNDSKREINITKNTEKKVQRRKIDKINSKNDENKNISQNDSNMEDINNNFFELNPKVNPSKRKKLQSKSNLFVSKPIAMNIIKKENIENPIAESDVQKEVLVKTEIISEIQPTEQPEFQSQENFKNNPFINHDSFVSELETIKNQTNYLFDLYRIEKEQKPCEGEKIIQGNHQFLYKWRDQMIAEALEVGGDPELSEMAFWDEEKEEMSQFQVAKCNQPSTNEWWINHGIYKDTFKVRINITTKKFIVLPVTVKFDTGKHGWKEQDKEYTEINQGWMFMFGMHNNQQIEDYLNLKVTYDPQSVKQLRQFNWIVQSTHLDEFQVETEQICHNTTEDTIKKQQGLREVVVQKDCKIRNFWLQIKKKKTRK